MRDLLKRSLEIHGRLSTIFSPGAVGLESERRLLSNWTTERALGLGSWSNDNLDVRGGCGADLTLRRGVGSCEDLPPWYVDSCSDADEWPRGRDGGRDDDKTEEPSFILGCDGAEADGLSSITGGRG